MGAVTRSPYFSLQVMQQARHVFADGFGQAGRGSADRVAADIGASRSAQPCWKIVAAAENRALLVKFDAAMSIGSLKMADDVAAHVGRAALRTVQKRQRDLQSRASARQAPRGVHSLQALRVEVNI